MSSATDATRFHPGEVAVQERAGVREQAERGGTGLHPAIPPVGAAFLRARDMAFIAASDRDGRPWGTVVTGAPGFLGVPDERTLSIAALPPPDDPVAEGVRAGAYLALIAMDFARRHRMRVNGRIGEVRGDGVVMRVEQAFSNCPRYIQRRVPTDGIARPVGRTGAARSADLAASQSAWIRRADTFFIATIDPLNGADISHRGGMPGFVRMEENLLVWGDYNGNAKFNTLGNIAVNPRAGLLFADLERGCTLQLTGTARIGWNPLAVGRIPGAERVIEFEVEEVVERSDAFPLRLGLVEYSPVNPDPA